MAYGKLEEIPYASIIMRCDDINTEAFSHNSLVEIIPYSEDLIPKWCKLQKGTGAFGSFTLEQIKKYFCENFVEVSELKEQLVFLRQKDTYEIVGTCMGWFESDGTPVLHWLAVKKGYEGKGYARVLISAIMKFFIKVKVDRSIYLHTQPSSYKAIKLYADFGFFLCKDTYGNRKNENTKGLRILNEVMDKSVYNKLSKEMER